MNNELEAIRKETVTAYYAGLCLEKLRENTHTVKSAGVSAEI